MAFISPRHDVCWQLRKLLFVITRKLSPRYCDCVFQGGSQKQPRPQSLRPYTDWQASVRPCALSLLALLIFQGIRNSEAAILQIVCGDAHGPTCGAIPTSSLSSSALAGLLPNPEPHTLQAKHSKPLKYPSAKPRNPNPKSLRGQNK